MKIFRAGETIRDTVPGFTGVISDVGGPTANMYRLACKSADIEAACRALAETLGVGLDFAQSNHEGELVDRIQAARKDRDALVISDALGMGAVGLPVAEATVRAIAASSNTSCRAVRLARISHQLPAAAAYPSVLTALRSVARLDVMHGYACGGLGRVPCQDGRKPAEGGLQRLVTKTYE